MEGNHSPVYGGTSASVSICTCLFLFIGAQAIGEILKAAAAGISIVAGLMAIRYYWFAIKEKKQNLKK